MKKKRSEFSRHNLLPENFIISVIPNTNVKRITFEIGPLGHYSNLSREEAMKHHKFYMVSGLTSDFDNNLRLSMVDMLIEDLTRVKKALKKKP